MDKNSSVKDILLFFAGLLGGYLTSSHFHNKQKTESTVFENKITSTLAKIYKLAAQNRDNNWQLTSKVTSIEHEIEPISDLIEIKNKLDEVLIQLKQSDVNKTEDLPTDLVLKYKALGDRWSEIVATQLNLQILNDAGEITTERLLSVHKGIFPDNYPWAGKFRDQHVFVIDRFGTTARIVDISAAESKIETIAPEAILSNLEKLLSYWNSNLINLTNSSSKSIIDEVAHFHHEFEIIHPFLDGNGRIGRMILEEQLSYLFRQKLTFRPDRDEYYRALRMLNMGEISNLRELIEEQLKKFNIAL